MPKARIGLLVIALAVGASTTAGLGRPEAGDELILKAQAFLEALTRGDFKAAAGDFDDAMRKAAPPEALAGMWKDLSRQCGGFKRSLSSRRERLGGFDVVLLTCEFGSAVLDIRVVFDARKRIAGFRYLPTYEPPKYADPGLFTESEVIVGDGDGKLPGTLTLPKGEGPFAALLLVHGSGPNDRDETIGPNKPFKDLAWGLASRGIAVLRYDKRSFAHRLKAAKDRSSTVREETIDDAAAAAALLSRTPKIDARRLFILGHSLGGMLVPRIAEAVRGPGPAGFIIMAGLTRPLEDAIVEQYTYILGLDGTLSDEDKKTLDALKSQAAAIRSLTEAGAKSGPDLMGAPPAYWLALRGYDPPREARRIDKPLLILQGGRDYQVTGEDFENWKKALDGRPGVEFRFYPAANHLFFEGRGRTTPEEYTATHGSVAAAVISDIAAFIERCGAWGR